MKKLPTALVIIVSLATTGAVCAQNFQKGLRAAQSGDFVTAIRQFKVLAEQGNTEAQFYLGVMCCIGKGVRQDYKEAVKWYRKAAEQEHMKARHALGVMYAKGRGIIQDNVYAHMCFNIAASSGHAHAVKDRDINAKEMTAADISTAQGLA